MSRFKQMVRPVVADAADSIESATGYPVARVLAWYDDAEYSEIQTRVMGAVQDAVAEALGIDMSGDTDYTNAPA